MNNLTVGKAFELAKLPIPDGAISFGRSPFIYNGWFGRVNMDSTTEHKGKGFCFYGDRWVFDSKTPELFEPWINLTNLSAKDAWEQLPEIVRTHPEVIGAMGTIPGIKDNSDNINYMITIPNELRKFRCECKCNVFRKGKPYDGLDVFQCNACGAEYSGLYTASSD